MLPTKMVIIALLPFLMEAFKTSFILFLLHVAIMVGEYSKSLPIKFIFFSCCVVICHCRFLQLKQQIFKPFQLLSNFFSVNLMTAEFLSFLIKI